MPPLYPGQFPNQYEDQYNDDFSFGATYNPQYNQYQYANPPPPQTIPPYSQIQINIPPRQQQHPPPPPPPQYGYQNNFQNNYAPQTTHYQQQYQPQPQYAPQYQQQPSPQTQMPPQQYYQPNQQYTAPPPSRIQVNIPKPQPTPPQRVLKDVQPTAIRQQPPTPKPRQPVKQEIVDGPDYDILLLTLADEYLEAAQKLSCRSEKYFKLTATAMGCIQAVLDKFKLPPLREAQVSLRYAQLLFDETENHDEAESLLTKTIDLCERLKYHDLKYAAQLLLTRVLYQSRPKAALKDLQGMIEDIEAYKHTAWEYAFRLQYVMFAMKSSQPSDIHIALSQLDRVCHVAKQHSDHPTLVFAAILEALIHLQANSADSVQSSQRSLAKARALQLNPDIEGSPQLCLMMEFVDLCGQLKNSDTAQSEAKRKAMQSAIYPALQSNMWRNDGLMYLPVNQASLRGLQTQDSGLIIERSGRNYLAFHWLLKDEVEDLGYLLCGVSAASKNAGDGGKAEKFLDEGLVIIKDLLEENQLPNSAGNTIQQRQLVVQCHLLLEVAFLQCSKGQWSKAQATIRTIDQVAQKLEPGLPQELRCLNEYVKGAIHQGRGELDAALNVFQSSTFSTIFQQATSTPVKPSSHIHRTEDTIRNVSILAAMNTIFIIQQPQHPQHQRLSTILSVIDPLASHHPNKTIQAAWNFVIASLPNNTILKMKQYLGNALNTAQSINNAQVTTLCLVTMQEKFFKGVIGDQALKCARAASHQAKRLNEPMWIAAANGLEAECLSVHGHKDESHKRREVMESAIRMLPEKVRAHAMGS